MTAVPAKYMYLFGGAIGDALLGVHIGRTLAAAAPGESLTLISTRVNPFVRDLLSPLPFVSYIEMPKNSPRSWAALPRLAARPRHIAVCQPLVSHLPLWWSIILRAATVRRNSRTVYCVANGALSAAGMTVDEISYNTDTDAMFGLAPKIVTAWGLPAAAMRPELDPLAYRAAPPPEITRPYLVLHFFGGIQNRTVLVAQARRVIEELSKKFSAYTLVLTCAKAEYAHAKQMAEGLKVQICCDLAAPAVVRLLADASAYVGVDTGITHIACHVGTPAVILGHAANLAWMPYYAQRAEILLEGATKEDPYRPIREVPVEAILEGLDRMLNAPHV